MGGFDLVGKKVKLIFEDLKTTIIKIGVVKEISNDFVTIKTEVKTEIIPKARILRMEVLTNG